MRLIAAISGLVCSVVALSGAVLLGQGYGPRPPELAMLVQQATLIVDAKVESIPPAYTSTGGGPAPRTDVVLRVSSVLKGTMTSGGQIVLLQAPGPANLMQLGERYIMFLREMPAAQLSEFPVRQGMTRYGTVSRPTAAKVDGDKIQVNPEMPFHSTLNGKSRDEFVREVAALINRQ